MTISRRDFLARNATGLSLVSLAGGVAPPLLHRVSAATTEAERQDRVLLIVELTGGNDGLNTVIPFEDAAYHRLRPDIAIGEGLHRLDDQFAFHPALEKLAQLFKEGRAAVVHGVGYPNPNRSHFRSLEIWHTGQPDQTTAEYGWLGRFLDGAGPPLQEKVSGIAFSERLPRSLAAQRASVPSISEIESYGLFVEGELDVSRKRELIQELAGPAEGPQAVGTAVEFLRRQAQATYGSAARLRAAAERFQPQGEYDGSLGRQLRMAVQVIAANLGTRVIHTSLDGFDTHANQPGVHAELLTQLSRGITEFLRDIDAMGRSDDVLIMTYSEFGRRVQQNGSHGTDHGAAAPMFFIGNKLQPGFHGEHPSLSDLDDGDLKFSTDFRSLYQAVLQDWFAANSVDILGGEFPKLALLQDAPANQG